MAPQRPVFALFMLLISFADFGHVQVCCLSSTRAPPPVPPPASDSCTAADNTPGLCVHLSKCQSLNSLFTGPKPLSSETISFLRGLICGDPAQRNICCSTKEIQTNRTVNVDHLLPDPNSCGLDYFPATAFVTHSFKFSTEIYEYAWLALVEYRNSNGSISDGCGATLVSKRYLITAGHCVLGEKPTQLGTPINIILGEYDKKNDIDCVRYGKSSNCNVGRVVIAIEEIITHPEYQPSQGTYKNDLAIIRLAKDAPFSDFIKPICLPNSYISTKSDFDTYIAGWGSNSDVKIHYQLPLVSLASCQAAYINSTTPGLLWDKEVCAGGEEVNACAADLGGPLMVRLVKYTGIVHWFLYGVLSFKPTPCDLSNMPAVYTKVFPYLEWVKAQIKE